MPTYTYRCTACHLQFENFQSITDPPLTTCPSCEGHLERVITGGSGLIFKGSGFYITDYKKNKNSDAGDKAGKSDSKGKEKARAEATAKND
ncbi:MAG: zinc ribbon domain-containing protein [Calditrichia bacterium]